MMGLWFGGWEWVLILMGLRAMKKATTKAPGLEGVQHGAQGFGDIRTQSCSLDQWTKKQVWKMMANTKKTPSTMPNPWALTSTWALGWCFFLGQHRVWIIGISSESAGDNGQPDPVNGYWYWDRSSLAKHIPWFLLVPGDTQVWPCPACSLFNLAGWRLQVGPQSGMAQDLRNFFFEDEHPQLPSGKLT